MEASKGRIHSIESFGTVDGPGIRYVVFFQGCRMRCLYCHNPDTWRIKGGTEMTAEEILEGMERNRPYYKDGGITCTGGEPLLQLPFLTELLGEAKERRIHTCLDTSGVPGQEDVERLRDFQDRRWKQLFSNLDLILMDFKHSEESGHRQLTGQQAWIPLAFARLAEQYQVPMIARHVLVPGITDREEQLRSLGKLLKGFQNLVGIDVLPYHRMGEVKYKNMGIPYPLSGVDALTAEDAARAKKIILDAMGNM